MKLDGALFVDDLAQVPSRARALEAAGYDAAVTAEISSDPFLPLALAAEHTERLELMTSIAVAFARNPMLLAQVSHDLNALSRGRFSLGLGSQIKPHITRRFSMPWSRPAARMREFILALRAIWDCWYTGAPLDFQGEFYTHTLMTPMFTPPDTRHGAPRVLLAAVGPRMTEVAGEVADGLIVHAFTTERYVRDVTLPALERGFARSGRRREDFQILCPVFMVTGEDEASFAQSRDSVRKQVAFYGSTPAYREVLGSVGRAELQTELHRLSTRGQWDAMTQRIDDALLAEFALVGEPSEIPGQLSARYGGIFDRVLCTWVPGDDPREAGWVKSLRAG